MSEEVRQRATIAILTDAVMTWPSALVIGLTIILTFATGQFYWLAVGAVLEVIYLVLTLSDPEARRQAVSRMLEDKFDPRDIKNIEARTRLQKALEYKKSIDAFINQQESALRVTLEDTAAEIDNWIEQIYLLAKNLDQFQSNRLIERDRIEAPTKLRNLQTRLKVERDPAVRAELQEAVNIQQRLVDDLQKVASLVKRTEIKMDNTVAQLSSLHTKLQQMAQTKQIDSNRARRLQQEIHDEVQELADIVSAMDDMYSTGGAAILSDSTPAASAGYQGALGNLSTPDDESTDYRADSDEARRRAGGR
jgi:chromosome segregation ATPase